MASVPSLHAAGPRVDPFLFSLGPAHDPPGGPQLLARLIRSVPAGRFRHVALLPFHEVGRRGRGRGGGVILGFKSASAASRANPSPPFRANLSH